jgi:hypothetical protein
LKLGPLMNVYCKVLLIANQRYRYVLHAR